MAHLVDSDRLECQPSPSSVREARLFVVDKLQEWRCDPLVDSAALMTSELATNAVMHTDRPYTVSVLRDGRTVRIEVFDTVGVLPELPEPTDDAIAHDPGALFSGLGLVERIATDWGSELVHGGKVVWFELQITDAPGRARTSDLADLRSPEPGEEHAEIAVREDGEGTGHPSDQQEAPAMARHHRSDVVDPDTNDRDVRDREVRDRDPRDDRRVIREEPRARRHPMRWLLLLLVIAVLAVAAFFALGGDADVDVDVNPPEDVNVETEDAPEADADADAGS